MMLYGLSLVFTSEVRANRVLSGPEAFKALTDYQKTNPSFDIADYFGSTFRGFATLLQLVWHDAWFTKIIRPISEIHGLAYSSLLLVFIFIVRYGFMTNVTGLIIHHVLDHGKMQRGMDHDRTEKMKQERQKAKALDELKRRLRAVAGLGANRDDFGTGRVAVVGSTGIQRSLGGATAGGGGGRDNRHRISMEELRDLMDTGGKKVNEMFAALGCTEDDALDVCWDGNGQLDIQGSSRVAPRFHRTYTSHCLLSRFLSSISHKHLLCRTAPVCNEPRGDFRKIWKVFGDCLGEVISSTCSDPRSGRRWRRGTGIFK